MPTVDNLDIQISTSLVNSNQQLDALIAKLNRVNSSLASVKGTTKNVSSGITSVSTSTNKSSKSFGGLASMIGRFYASCFLAIRGAKALGNAIKDTANYIEAFNYFEVSFNKIASDWGDSFEQYGYKNAKEYSESFVKRARESLSKLSGVQVTIDENGKGLLTETGMKNLGLNIQEITQYASQLASVTNSVGQTGEVSLATANAFTKLAGDISSLFNQDYSAVAKNLQSGLIGQSRALYKYGIDITNATLQQKAYELGLSKSVSEMSQAEKMQLRMLVILRDSRVAWGDLANTINSPSNMIRQFTNNLKEAGMILGQLFLPILQKVLPYINGVTIAIKRLLVNIAGILGIKLDLDQFGQGGSNAEDTFDGISDSLDGVAESAKKAKAGIRGFDELKTISAPKSSSSGSGSGVGSTIDLTNEILKATQEYEKVWDEAYAKMEQKAEKIAKKLEKVFKPIEKLFEDISAGDWFSVGEDVSEMGNNIIAFVSKAIKEADWEKAGKDFGDFFEGSMRESFKGLPLLGTLITDAVTGINDFLTNAISSVDWKGSVEDLLNGIQGFLENLKIEDIIGTLTNVINALNNAIIDIIDYLIENPDEVAKTIGLLVLKIIELIGYTLLSQTNVATNLIAGILESILGNVFKNTDFDFAENIEKNFSEFTSDFGGNIGKAFSTVGKHIQNALDAISGFFVDLGSGIGKSFSNTYSYIQGIWQNASSWFDEKVIQPISEIFTGLWIIIKAIWITAKDWFKEKVADRVLKVFKDLWSGIKGIWKNAKDWFEEKVTTPISNKFTKAKTSVSNAFSSALGTVKEKWKNVKDWFEEKVTIPVKNAFKNATDSISGFFTNIWKSIKNGAVSTFNSVIGAIEKGINFLVGGINKIISGFNKVVSWASGITGDKWDGVELVQKVTIKRIPIEQYEVGGFPRSASLFWANENGVPELVGQMGGKTAVASGAEITGIKDAIYSTGQQETNLMATMVGLLRVIADKDFGITDDQIGRSAQRFAKNYFNRTGNEAYSF